MNYFHVYVCMYVCILVRIRCYTANIRCYTANIRCYTANIQCYTANIRCYTANIRCYTANSATQLTFGATQLTCKFFSMQRCLENSLHINQLNYKKLIAWSRDFLEKLISRPAGKPSLLSLQSPNLYYRVRKNAQVRGCVCRFSTVMNCKAFRLIRQLFDGKHLLLIVYGVA